MAKITEQKISITMSKLVRDGESSSNLIQPDVVSTLEQVVQELVGADSGIIVEVDIES